MAKKRPQNRAGTFGVSRKAAEVVTGNRGSVRPNPTASVRGPGPTPRPIPGSVRSAPKPTPAASAPAPPPQAPTPRKKIDPFLTPEQQNALDAAYFGAADSLGTYDDSMRSGITNANYQKLLAAEAAIKTADRAQNNAAARGTYFSSIKDAELFDIDKAQQRQINYFDTTISDLQTGRNALYQRLFGPGGSVDAAERLSIAQASSNATTAEGELPPDPALAPPGPPPAAPPAAERVNPPPAQAYSPELLAALKAKEAAGKAKAAAAKAAAAKAKADADRARMVFKPKGLSASAAKSKPKGKGKK